ncbi:nucleoside deaminase [Brachybacterium halotolerans subsp. kimchii]|uniref:nucleoside deaminase n=1 Tax=Brachybacterium halotolerans TaxID=2795215 RepID=UPI001E61D22C|nr:nucleoside deaminase [Brachybacterium halotolerans]UEJ81422.1 nucleoside deaminase [Brachybacterium halotolerans subsp. kimchii]
MDLVTTLHVELPGWLVARLEELPPLLPTVEEQMDVADELADLTWRSGDGGPFAALVVEEDGALVSVGVNLVPRTGLSALHAEVTALSLAQQRTGSWDLGAGGARRRLVVNARPCVQCFGAVLWSGVRSLVIGADGPEVEEATGFDEGPMVADWVEQLSARGIDVTTGVRHAQSLQVLRDFGASGSLVYNARGE